MLTDFHNTIIAVRHSYQSWKFLTALIFMVAANRHNFGLSVPWLGTYVKHTVQEGDN